MDRDKCCQWLPSFFFLSSLFLLYFSLSSSISFWIREQAGSNVNYMTLTLALTWFFVRFLRGKNEPHSLWSSQTLLFLSLSSASQHYEKFPLSLSLSHWIFSLNSSKYNFFGQESEEGEPGMIHKWIDSCFSSHSQRVPENENQ